MTIRRKQHPWYDFKRIDSYNATFNFIAGGRGIGKTYGAKKKAIRKAIKTGEQFIYLRRYKTEITASKTTFFADIGQEFPEYQFRIQGNAAQMAPASSEDDRKQAWQTIGYFVALSTAQSQKGVSYHLVTTVIFDEFIIEKGNVQYLPNEVIVMTNFYSTVDRYQDKTKVYFLANSVSINNPYFDEYGIKPDQDITGEIISPSLGIDTKGFIVAHFPDSADFAMSIYETAFGKFIKNTDYADYAVGNQFADNTNDLVAVKNSNFRYHYTLETKKNTFSVWYSRVDGEYFIQKKRPKTELIYTMLASKMGEDKTLILFNDKPLASLRTAFRHARVTFDEPSTRNAFTEIFKR